MVFCSKCGKGDQETDSYCRNCGEFLVDASSRSSLVNRVFGVSNPEKQISLTMTVDLVTAIFSGVLLFALMGYFDATEQMTGISTSPLVYVLYAFLTLVAVWQLVSFMVGTQLKRKLKASRQANLRSQVQSEQSLPPANEKEFIPITITEQTTRKLDHAAKRD